MSEAYAREILRRNVAQICQTIGWNGINSTPLDILVHILEKYIRTLGTQSSRYAEQFERTEPNLSDLGLVFRDLHIQLPELAEYTRSVPPVPPPVTDERFPKPKDSHLNFLKPGSHEVVTRPMHVHEHLPPMYPEKERETPVVADTVEIRQNGIDSVSTSNATCNSPEISVTDSPEKAKDPFKRPIDPISLPSSKKPRLRLDEEERTREISSVMMTMSGFLSPAREGKLPEAKPPTIVSERHHNKHKSNIHPNLMKVPSHPSLEKSDKKSKKSSKLVNGKIMKSKRKDKSHKGDSKSKEGRDKYPPGHPSKSRLADPGIHNHITMPAPKAMPVNKPLLPPVVPLPMEMLKPVIKQEPPDLPPPPVKKNQSLREDSIPVPRKIPISKSPLVASTVNKHPNPILPPTAIKKEVLDEEEKLASQPDRSKVNIFKRISNKSKEDKHSPEVPEKSQNASISRVPDIDSQKSYEHVKVKTENSVVNNNDSDALDVMDLTTNEVISLDDDSLDMSPMPMRHDQRPSPMAINRTPEMPYPKDVPIPGVSPKVKKEKKHKDKKDKAAKLEAKLLKKQQQQLAFEMAQAQKQSLKMGNPPKAKRPKNDSKMSQLPPGFPFFPNMPPGGLIPGPGLIPNHGLMSNDILANLANNPALRGLAPPNLMNNPFALPSGPGLIPGMMPGVLGHGLPNPLMPMGNFGHSSRSSSSKIPSMLRRPSLEVIAVDNDEDRGLKSPRDRHEKHKSQTIPNILQKHKKSHKEHNKNMLKMPPIHPDITIELNPPKQAEVERQEPPREAVEPPPRARSPSPEPVREPAPAPASVPIATPSPVLSEGKDSDKSEKTDKKKDKKKDKKDKDGIKLKKKKDKKDKNKDKTEKKKDKEERVEGEIKDKIKKEKKEKKKEKAVDGLVPKLTLKLGSASPMPPSSPDLFKLNIKPVVKKEEDDSPSKEDPGSREGSRSPELAQFSALVTRPPKPKHSKHNHTEEPKSPPASSSSPPRKNRPPSGHKFKRILFKSLKKGHIENFDEEMETEEVEQPPPPAEKPTGPLPTPYYVDDHGNKIWVCPACGRPDNGSPMIGCDGCDGWYHWVCVGITEEPGATEDWFCKSCTAKRAAMVFAGMPSKKRGRKPKGEKVRD